MDRVEIKEWSKEKIVGNKWNLWKAILVVGLITGFAGGLTATMTDKNMATAISSIIELFMLPLQIGLVAFCIRFVRNEETNIDVIFDQYSNFMKILFTTILTTVLISIGFVLLIVPGIYLALSYSLVPYLLVERKDLSITEILSTSRKMMKGHKFDFFILGLSFFGWLMLTPFTLGLLNIWLIPYMTVAETKFLVDVMDNYKED